MNATFVAPSASQSATHGDDPGREIKIGAFVAGLFFVGFVGWSAVSQLDAAAFAPGSVKVSGDRQVVQSLEGGIVSAVHVHEGETVHKGQLLIEFATAEATAQDRSLAARIIDLRAQVARLEAERAGAATMTEPAEFANLTGDDRNEAERAMAAERGALQASRIAAAAQRTLLAARVAQIGHQIDGFAAQLLANGEQQSLNREELEGISALYARGLAAKTRVLALQRSAAGLSGENGADRAEIARLRSLSGEAHAQLVQFESNQSERVAAELRTAYGELQTLLPQSRVASSQLARTQVRAPISGQVMGLAIRRAGAIAAPGERLADVVPADRSLTVEAQVAPTDANDLAVGQQARVRFSGLQGRMLPLADGIISRVSADSFTDERSGRTFYTASVRVTAAELDRIGRAAGVRGAIKPGTPVQVEVVLRPRSALSYWIEPLLQSFNGTLHER